MFHRFWLTVPSEQQYVVRVLDFRKNRFLVAESMVYSFKKPYTFVCNKISVACLPTGLYEPEWVACSISPHGHATVKLTGSYKLSIRAIIFFFVYSSADSLLPLSEDQYFCSMYLTSSSFKDSSVLGFPVYTNWEQNVQQTRSCSV